MTKSKYKRKRTQIRKRWLRRLKRKRGKLKPWKQAPKSA